MCLRLAKPLDANAHQQRNRTTTAVVDDKHTGLGSNIIRVIRTEDLRWRLHTNMYWRLASTMLLADYAALLISRVSLDSTNDVPSGESQKDHHCKEQYSRFFAHV